MVDAAGTCKLMQQLDDDYEDIYDSCLRYSVCHEKAGVQSVPIYNPEDGNSFKR